MRKMRRGVNTLRSRAAWLPLRCHPCTGLLVTSQFQDQVELFHHRSMREVQRYRTKENVLYLCEERSRVHLRHNVVVDEVGHELANTAEGVQHTEDHVVGV
jgi:hypothetical protein